MPTFVESDLQFSFPDHWYVKAFDQERFYKNTSGYGIKGVDFVAIDPLGEGHLFLIEVKNYRTRITDSGAFVANLKNADRLVEVLIGKYEDSSRLIRAIYTHFSRRWWYRLLRRQLTKSKALHREGVFWLKVYDLLTLSSRKTFVLWVEMENTNENYLRYLDQQLSKKLGSHISTEVAPAFQRHLIGVQAKPA